MPNTYKLIYRAESLIQIKGTGSFLNYKKLVGST